MESHLGRECNLLGHRPLLGRHRRGGRDHVRHGGHAAGRALGGTTLAAVSLRRGAAPVHATTVSTATRSGTAPKTRRPLATPDSASTTPGHAASRVRRRCVCLPQEAVSYTHLT